MRQVEINKSVNTQADSRLVEYTFVNKIGNPITGWKLVIKRVFDLLVGLLGSIISLPIIMVFAFIVKTTSKGPAFYKQERVGFMGSTFNVIKIRSMYQDAEARTGAVWAQKNDPRITPIGRFMRKTRVDELPQFWNVLKGDMSLVGPRPERPILTEKFSKSFSEFPKRLRIIPGITGYAQINGGYDITPDAKCKLDNYYIEHYSLWFDIKMLLGTVKIVFTGDGAR
ncbi:sugar transferase [Companilactobacillus kimchii]|uniref:Priming glycosyltransferase n=2 Tax=Companilactobacillus kimchii TaxID=2801452 RepID=A0ABR5NW29_9LACO|nr:sugar transferase [Companilactobacillus kimchii]GEO48560.1 capsular polysaccharide biosynthesis protein [Companilactobacillus paralimentarius]KAE9559729.1 UDP-phosphate N-acetylgalactosaminyl-1-phosphate transferase [Companilactobacillus kimchii]KAE9561373.1 UDP-phosphate N-acetylgalactosaminyl-1-phosphate transferase [Companilactobacillus kimchii]KRK53044.1 priming glycosyltransferase [Companilactobacillus kimchii DSM 13961 = JCM 10707]OWF31894.1 Exopolysaccharide production protein PSS [C